MNEYGLARDDGGCCAERRKYGGVPFSNRSFTNTEDDIVKPVFSKEFGQNFVCEHSHMCYVINKYGFQPSSTSPPIFLINVT